MTSSTSFKASLPKDLYKHASFILGRLHEAGHEAYVAGGAVRDYLLGRPLHDLDIATSAQPAQVRELFRRTVAVGEHFGVIIVMLEQYRFEVATFRSDHGYSDGRRPDQVRFCSAREDVARRDFTVNGMFWDPMEDRVYDWVEGKLDLQRRLIRTIGSPIERFEEDKLRMLRALRFAAQLDFRIDEETLVAMKRLAAEIVQVSMERIREEFDRLFHTQALSCGLGLLQDSGLAGAIAGRFCQEAGFSFSPPASAYSLLIEWAASRQRVDSGFAGAPWLCLLLGLCGVAAEELGPNQWRELAQVLRSMTRAVRLSNEEASELDGALRVLCHLPVGHTLSLAGQKRLLRDTGFPLAMQCLPQFFPSQAGRIQRWSQDFLAEYGGELHVEALLRGDDLLTLGVPHGPQVGDLLRELEDAQLEHRLSTRAEAEAMVRARLSRTE